MSEKNKQSISEKEISILAEKSLKESENALEVKIIKKKYLEKGGIIPQLFQQVGQEKDLVRKKKLGNLVNE